MKVPMRKRILKKELSGKEFHNYSQNTSKARAEIAEEKNQIYTGQGPFLETPTIQARARSKANELH